MGSTTIHPFPELRALAEEEARAYATTSDGTHHEAIELFARVRFTLMLCDLTRPASRDAVARLVATRVGLDLAGVHQRLALPGFPLLRLYDYCGVPDTAQGNGEHTPAEALALIVRHLWPEESPRE